MSLRFDFDAAVCESSSFQYKKMDIEDLRLLHKYNLKQWDDKVFADESILKRGHWTINGKRDKILKAIGGGAFEIPEMYTFVYNEVTIKIECGGGGDPARTFIRYDDGNYDEQINISNIIVPNELSLLTEDILSSIAEALAIEGYKWPQLNRISIVFMCL